MRPVHNEILFHQNFSTSNFLRYLFLVISSRVFPANRSHILLHGVFLRPFPGQLVVTISVRFVNTRNFRHQRIVGIRVAKQWANAQKHFRYGQSWRPLTTQNVQTNATVAIDVRMINSRSESDFRRFKRIIGRKMNGEKEDATLVRTVRRSHDRRLPMKQIVSDWTGGT